eukprot:COSAG06_NODE_2427_length_6899_cov_2.921912_3_plen_78_part_00
MLEVGHGWTAGAHRRRACGQSSGPCSAPRRTRGHVTPCHRTAAIQSLEARLHAEHVTLLECEQQLRALLLRPARAGW